jgi:8-oxo-dGTP diphosphatase
MKKRPLVGIGTIIRNENKVLFLKRKGAHGKGSWAFIGGHWEFGETPEEGASREVKEEIDINVKNPKAVYFTNDYFPKEQKHYITIYVVADYAGDKININEPQYVEKVGWYKWGKYPKPIFIPLQNLFKTDFNPFNYK